MIPASRFVELNKELHDRDSFDCGAEDLNVFLQQSAARHMQAGISMTMVLPEQQNQSSICAYYTLSHTEIERQTLPKMLANKLPRYPIPVLLIAQLAVHKLLQGHGFGKITMICALRHCHKINQHLPSYAVVLDALEDSVQGFYTQYGFSVLDTHKQRTKQLTRLFLPMKAVEKLFE